jgi:hypothetical protein
MLIVASRTRLSHLNHRLLNVTTSSIGHQAGQKSVVLLLMLSSICCEHLYDHMQAAHEHIGQLCYCCCLVCHDIKAHTFCIYTSCFVFLEGTFTKETNPLALCVCLEAAATGCLCSGQPGTAPVAAAAPAAVLLHHVTNDRQ